MKSIFAKFALFLSLLICGFSVGAEEKASSVMNVSTFNMLFSGNPAWGDWAGNKNFNGHLYLWWQARKSRVASVILFHELDIVGSQELMPFQIDELIELLPDYKFVGKPDRTIHKIAEFQHLGEKRAKFEVVHSMMFNAIFYNSNRFEELENGIFALSSEPDNLKSMGWDKETGQYRTCVWARFREKKTGITLLFLNIHTNCIDCNETAKSCELVLSKIKQFRKNNEAVFVTGDFNVPPSSPSIKMMKNSGILDDAFAISKLKPHGASNSNPNECERAKIDYIFVSKGIEVFKYGILTDHVTTDEKKGNYYKGMSRYPSDHYPEMAKVAVPIK